MSRKAIEGVVRYANGRINWGAQSKAVDSDGKASPRIQRERDLFNARCFKGGGQAVHSRDAIGQLWLVGKLDVNGYDETRLLRAARDWWEGREALFQQSGYATGSGERTARSTNPSARLTKVEKNYYRYQKLLDGADRHDAKCLADLMEPLLDGQPQHWAARIVQTETLRYFQFPLSLLACDKDYALLGAAKRALLVMAGAAARMNSEAA